MIHDHKQPCGCYSYYDSETHKKTSEPCELHMLARKHCKPYSEFSHIGGSLCFQCHGFDEVRNQTVCVCSVWEQLNKLDIELNAIKKLRGKGADRLLDEFIKGYDKTIAELVDEVDRVRKRRGH